MIIIHDDFSVDLQEYCFVFLYLCCLIVVSVLKSIHKRSKYKIYDHYKLSYFNTEGRSCPDLHLHCFETQLDEEFYISVVCFVAVKVINQHAHSSTCCSVDQDTTDICFSSNLLSVKVYLHFYLAPIKVTHVWC